MWHSSLTGLTSVCNWRTYFKTSKHETLIRKMIERHTKWLRGIPNDWEAYQMIGRHTKLLGGIPNDWEAYQMIERHTKWLRGIPNDWEAHQMIGRHTKWLRGIPNDWEAYQMIERHTKWLRGIPNPRNCMSLTCVKTIQGLKKYCWPSLHGKLRYVYEVLN